MIANPKAQNELRSKFNPITKIEKSYISNKLREKGHKDQKIRKTMDLEQHNVTTTIKLGFHKTMLCKYIRVRVMLIVVAKRCCIVQINYNQAYVNSYSKTALYE